MKKQFMLLGFTLTLISLFAVPFTGAQDPTEGRDSRAEVRFLEGMIDHHQMALDMAGDCLAKAESESLLTLCQNIIDTQAAEIETMRGWLLDWYNIAYTPAPMSTVMGLNSTTMGDLIAMLEAMDMTEDTSVADMMAHMSSMDDSGSGHAGHGSTDEGPFTDMPMMMGMMAGLDRLEGVEYEIAWLESMIDHHDDALHMSERILQRAIHPETAELAQQIIDAQTAEITQMESMIEELSA